MDFVVVCAKSVIRKQRQTTGIWVKTLMKQRHQTSSTIYLDANNLYGLAMSMKLPIGKLKWIKKMLTEKNIMDWNENDDNAYILEVGLEYPKELHNEHSDYPLEPESMSAKEEFLSEHQRTLHKH